MVMEHGKVLLIIYTKGFRIQVFLCADTCFSEHVASPLAGIPLICRAVCLSHQGSGSKCPALSFCPLLRQLRHEVLQSWKNRTRFRQVSLLFLSVLQNSHMREHAAGNVSIVVWIVTQLAAWRCYNRCGSHT